METPSDFVIPNEIDPNFSDLESKLMAMLGEANNSGPKIGELRYLDTSIYKGALEGNKRNGFGTLVTPNLKYEGQWKDDKMGDGPGELTQGQIHYKGSFSNNLFSGYGSLKTPEYTYEGHFENGVRNGSGKI